jgi:hypothetical protein
MVDARYELLAKGKKGFTTEGKGTAKKDARF